MQPMGEPCPICRRMDGGHDQAVHEAYDQGVKSFPPKGALR